MKNPGISRKDFLRSAFLTLIAGYVTGVNANLKLTAGPTGNSPNILILLLDSLSARDISIYGYQRETTPNLAEFAEKSTVFHQHHSAGNFTSPSTASLLTGTYPWTHRTFQLFGALDKKYRNQNIFSLLPSHYTTFGYTQNTLVEIMLNVIGDQIDLHPPVEEVSLFNERLTTTRNDFEYSLWGERIARGELMDIKTALYTGTFIDLIDQLIYELRSKPYQDEFPLGVEINNTGISYILRDVYLWLEEIIGKLPSPYFSYVHLYPPHEPYRPQEKFLHYFTHSPNSPEKPEHVFTENRSTEFLSKGRLTYDQYIAYTDQETGTFLKRLEDSGAMENTYIILTSDHGELFERGVWGHLNPLMYEALTHIPLLIHKPGQTKREDVHTPTSIVDILPTICHITGQPIPTWAEGDILPTFDNSEIEDDRTIFFVEAKENSKFLPLTKATTGLIKWPYKLIHYFGYEQMEDSYELFNLEDDPEELNNLYDKIPDIANILTTELMAKQAEADQPYKK